MWIVESYELWGLFLLCFLAATILPLSSEFGVLYCLASTNYNDYMIIAVASTGNILGGVCNYAIGYYGSELWKKRFGFRDKNRKIQLNLSKYGAPAAFLSWLPFIGDPLLVALGFYKTPWKATFLWMAFGKISRYLVLLLLNL